jgi:hypothetical protein
MTRWHIAGSLALLASLGPAAARAQSTDLEPGVQTSPPPAGNATTATAPAAPRETAPAAAPQSSAAHGGSARKARPDEANAAGPGGASSAGSTPATGPTRTGTGSRSQDRIELDTTQISGNRELPKVMYVVPWRKADLGDFAGRPPNSLLDEALTPVDRDVFRRQNRYFSALQAGAGDPKSQPGVTGGVAAGAESRDEK